MEGFPCVGETVGVGVVGGGGDLFDGDALPDGVAVAEVVFAAEVAHDDVEGVVGGGDLLGEDDAGVVPVWRQQGAGSGEA